MSLDPLFLSRLQFGFTIMFHYIFPPLSIGLGVLMVIMEGLYLRTGDRHYEAIARFWTRIFAVNFAMGVATGIVMEFQFGTNWSRYSRYVGDVFGSALAAEGIFAFFLESGFLAVLVFGWDRVGKKMHFFSTCMVALGAMFSSVWIIIANSWMQTPSGHKIVNPGTPLERAEIVDFWAMVLNPSTIPRLGHVLMGSYILASFFVMSIAAYYVLTRQHQVLAGKMFTIALIFGTLASFGAPAFGHLQAEIVAHHQPAKLAALEGHYKTGPATLWLFGMPNDKTQTVDFGIGIPGGLSMLVHNNFTEPVKGLDAFKPEDRPPVPLVFFTYHVMVGLGSMFMGLTVVGLYLRWKNRLFSNRPIMWVFVFAVIGPYIANQAGWVSAEVGRQPWAVYGILRTSQAVSTNVPAGQIVGSIFLFGIIYLLLFAVWLYVLNDKIQHGPDDIDKFVPPDAARPLVLADVAAAMAGKDGTMTMATHGEKEEAAETRR
jgi:cytochrome d ubiquinol oxidase subunit I